MHADPHSLGLRIAGLRHAAGWSQRRLAEAAGVSPSYIALLELGRLPSPGKFRLDSVARALNLRTADALLAPTLASTPLVRQPAPHEFQGSANGLSSNVIGGLEALRAAGARPLPVFRWGACGD